MLLSEVGCYVLLADHPVAMLALNLLGLFVLVVGVPLQIKHLQTTDWTGHGLPFLMYSRVMLLPQIVGLEPLATHFADKVVGGCMFNHMGAILWLIIESPFTGLALEQRGFKVHVSVFVVHF